VNPPTDPRTPLALSAEGTSATVVSPDAGTTKRYVDMAIVRHFAVGAMITALSSGAITKLEIIASASTDASSPEVIKDSGTIAADAQGDWAVEECSAEEIAQIGSAAGKALRYAFGRITVSNAGSEAAVVYVSLPVHAYNDLTPATTIA